MSKVTTTAKKATHSIAYKYRFYPTKEQQEHLVKTFGCVRKVYNCTLAHRNEQYAQGIKLNYNKTSKYLTSLKKELDYLQEVSSVALQQALRNQDNAFKKFFKKEAKYPNFKKKFAKQSFQLMSNAFKLEDKQLTIAKLKEPLQLIWHRELNFKPSSITISKDSADRYFVAFCGEVAITPKDKVTKNIGVDVGLTSLIATSNNEKVAPLKALLDYQLKLALLQRRLSKKANASKDKNTTEYQGKNRAKARLKVAKVHAKITDCRKDFIHKLSSRLINENQVICLEDLHIKGMVRNKRLAKYIHDASL